MTGGTGLAECRPFGNLGGEPEPQVTPYLYLEPLFGVVFCAKISPRGSRVLSIDKPVHPQVKKVFRFGGNIKRFCFCAIMEMRSTLEVSFGMKKIFPHNFKYSKKQKEHNYPCKNSTVKGRKDAIRPLLML